MELSETIVQTVELICTHLKYVSIFYTPTSNKNIIKTKNKNFKGGIVFRIENYTLTGKKVLRV